MGFVTGVADVPINSVGDARCCRSSERGVRSAANGSRVKKASTVAFRAALRITPGAPKRSIHRAAASGVAVISRTLTPFRPPKHVSIKPGWSSNSKFASRPRQAHNTGCGQPRLCRSGSRVVADRNAARLSRGCRLRCSTGSCQCGGLDRRHGLAGLPPPSPVAAGLFSAGLEDSTPPYKTQSRLPASQ